MSLRFRGFIARCFAIGVALGLAANQAAAYDSADTRLPSPGYYSTNDVVFNTVAGPIRIHSFFDVFADFHRFPGPPLGGPTEVHSFFDVFTELSYDLAGGPTQTATTGANGDMSAVRLNGLPPGEPWFDLEMLSMNLSGGTLPAGVMIRESPTRPSLGQIRQQSAGGGGGGGVYHIDSFFDVFTELSIDGGQTWMPSSNDEPLHLVGRLPEPSSLTLLAVGAAALAGRLRRRRAVRVA